MKRTLPVLILLVACTAHGEQLGTTIEVGETGFDVMRPVLASACPHGCPWGELGEFVREALAPVGFDVILCRNCNRAYGPGLVSKRAYPPALDRQNLFVGTTERVNAPVDFGITATDNLSFAYKGSRRYADEGPYTNLRLIARIEDPRWLMVAVRRDSGITDLGQIAERKLGVTILANPERPAVKLILDHYGITPELLDSWGGGFGRASILRPDAEFDVIIDTNAGPSNNPEAAYWTDYTYRHDLAFLELPEALLNRLASDEMALERATAKWGLLRGVDRPIRTVVRNGHAIFARADLRDEVAYAIAKAIHAHRGDLSTYIRPYAYNAAKVAHGFGVPLHPGAKRFYAEMGFLEPACVPELTRRGAAIYHPPRMDEIPSGWLEEEYEFACSALDTTYRTTLNVVRPRRLRDFSGVIVVEPTHPGNLWPVRATTASYLQEAGHASVAVNSSAFVVERFMKPVNGDAYAALSVPNYSRMENEILHQVALAIRRQGFESTEGHWGNEATTRLILAGYSNTGGKLRSYIDHFRARYADVYDGYLVGQTAVGTLPGPLPDLAVPVIELQGEREILATLNRNPGGLTYRRPDGENFRLYEVPGMAHLNTSMPERVSFPASMCGIETYSTFPLHHAWGNVLDLLVRWVAMGEPAPHAPTIAMAEDGATILRDEHGNATGGVPVPQILVPAATIHTISERNPDFPRARCDMVGPQFDFTKEKLVELYGSHRGYLKQVKQALRRLGREGWYLPMYRDEVIAAAEALASNFE